jgi:hypothetical protein
MGNFITKMDELIIGALKVPYADIRPIVKAAGKFASGNYGKKEKAPKVQAYRSLFAWTLMVVYRDSPARLFLGLFCLVFLLPFFFFSYLFS